MIDGPVLPSRKARWATAVLGALLLAEGTGKLLDPAGYVDALRPFSLIPDLFLWPVGVLWISAELVSGFGLLLGALAIAPPERLVRIAARLAITVTVAYFLMTSQAYMRGLVIENCTCFGVYLAQRLSWFVIVQDIYMIVYATWQERRVRAWWPTESPD